MKINSKTTLRTIISLIYRDFGICITSSVAHEIKDQIRRGVAVWTSNRYVSTVTGGINQITPNGVRYNTVWYSKEEWNNV